MLWQRLTSYMLICMMPLRSTTRGDDDGNEPSAADEARAVRLPVISAPSQERGGGLEFSLVAGIERLLSRLAQHLAEAR